MLLRLSGGVDLPSDTVVLLGDHPLPKACWHLTFPKCGTIISVRTVAHDSQMLRTVALIGVAVAATWVTGGAGGFLTAGTWQAGAAGAATMAVGMLAIDALIPLPQEKFETQTNSPTLAVTGTRNAERPFSPVPQILGTFRYTPPLSATPFTSLSGDNVDLTMLFTSGYGPLAISDLRIGNTPLDNFTGAETEVNPGFNDDEAITIYPGDAQQDDLNVRVYYGEWNQRCDLDPHPDQNPCTETGDDAPDHPWIVTPAEDPPCDTQPNCYTRVTATSCYKFRVDITLPGGLIEIKDQGDRNKRSVDVEVWYRISGSASNFTFGGSVNLNEKTNSVLRRSVEVTPGDATEELYEVLVRRLQSDDREGPDPDGDNTRYSRTDWTALVAFSNVDPVAGSPGNCVAEIGLKIVASSQLSGVIENFNFLGTSICLDYDGIPGSWTKRATNNPAALFRYILQGQANRNPVADCRIDISKLEEWHDFCFTKGFTFNQVRDFQATVADALTDCAAAGRARFSQSNGLWSVVVDDHSNYVTPVQLFTPRNSWGFTGNKKFIDQPHAFRVRFVDADNNYEQTEIIVYAPGYNVGTATRFESIEFPGLTNVTENTTMAQYQLAVAQYRQETFSFSADIEQIVCIAGDSILVQNDAIKVGIVAARIKAIAGNTVTLDSEFEVPASTSAVLRYDTGSTIATRVDAVTPGATAGQYTNQITYTTIPAEAQVGDLITVGETSQETLHLVVDAITPGINESAVIKCFPVAPETDI